MKKLCKIIPLLITSIFTLGGCKYSSSYSALSMVRTNTSKSASMSFSSFKGRMVFNMKWSGNEDELLTYSASITTGAATIYYDDGNDKTELFHIDSDETITSSKGGFEKGTLYIIVETSERCEEGYFRFSIN